MQVVRKSYGISLAVAACSLGLLLAAGWAQLPVSQQVIRGQLENQSGAPLVNAELELESWSGEPLGRTVTDGQGGFVFPGIGPGQYRLRGVYEGQVFERDFSAVQPGVVTIVHARVGRKPVSRAAANPAADMVSLNDLEAPKAAKRRLAKARAALSHHDYAKAMRLGDQAIAQAPNWGAARMFRGVLRMQQRHYALAAQDLRAAVQAEPSDALALTALGADYERMKMLPPAHFYLSRAIQVQPGLWQEYFEMAQLDLDEHQSRAAIASAGKALRAVPAGPPTAHLLRADGYIQLQQWAKAKGDIQLYLEVAPKGHDAAAAKRTLGEIERVEQRAAENSARPHRP